jgi:hypothetical protein
MRRLPLAALGLFCAASAVALELPPRKAGLWDIRMTFDAPGIAPQAMQQCVDAATDKLMNNLGADAPPDMCPRQDVNKAGDTIVVDTLCRVDDVTIASHGVITGNFDSAYTAKVTSRRTGGPREAGPGSTTRVTIEARWTGPCKADHRPGDIIMPNGMKTNIRDLQ